LDLANRLVEQVGVVVGFRVAINGNAWLDLCLVNVKVRLIAVVIKSHDNSG
jgi:hypothetical protein